MAGAFQTLQASGTLIVNVVQRSPVLSPKLAVLILGMTFAIAIWLMHDTLLLVFAGALLALMLRRVAEAIARTARIAPLAGVWIGVVMALAAVVLTFGLLGNAIALQMNELQAALPSAFEHTIQQLRAMPAAMWLTSNLPSFSAIIPDSAHLLARATGIISGALGLVVGILVIVFVGVAGALEPQLYVRGLLSVFPAAYRDRLHDVIDEAGRTLQIWLLSRLLTMTVTAILVTVGLTILRAPLPVALGILAGLLAFIPNIGAIIAAIPAVLLAFVSSPRAALFVIVMYVMVHIIDDFIVAPVVERQVVKLPPILTLVAQIVMGIGAGVIGVMLAAPIVSVVIVLVRRLWVEDIVNAPRAEAQCVTRQEIGSGSMQAGSVV